MELLETHAQQLNYPIVYLGYEECYANASELPYIIESFQSVHVEVPRYHLHFWKETKIYQALLYCQEHEEHQYQGKFADLTFIRWHRLSMDVLPTGGSKAKGIEIMLAAS